jgi:hypothetical protein
MHVDGFYSDIDQWAPLSNNGWITAALCRSQMYKTIAES